MRSTRCCVAGGGPAGMMLGLLLARAGVQVTVLEKHGDFLRDFRGDTVHPSTLEVMHELGLLEEFLRRPFDKATELRVQVGNEEAALADFTGLKTRCGFIAMMPQWEFLDFLRDHAVRYRGFELSMNTEATGLLERDGRVRGVRARDATGEFEIAADLVVGCDGRRSTLRGAAGLKVHDLGAPIDVLWMRISKRPTDTGTTGGRIATGSFLAIIDRGTYWQTAFVIAKGGMQKIRAAGIDAFRGRMVTLVPMFASRIETDLASWDDVKLLSVSVDRLEQWWKPGLLCIGDAAHAMSPIGGVGINLAIQDAVATANILAVLLSDSAVSAESITPYLAKVHQRRLFPTRITQAVQVMAQNNLINPLLDSTQPPTMPFVLKLFNRFRFMRRWPAYAVGVGVRPEHVHSPEKA